MTASPPALARPSYFPYVYTPERDLPRYALVRAEGRPLRESLWNGLSYLRKYHKAKWSAPTEEICYFQQQRRLLRWLTHGPEAGLRLALVGDLMWLRDGWHSFLCSDVLSYLNGHAVVFGNLETPISTRLAVPRLLPDYFTYNSDPALLTSFTRPSGSNTFSALSTANNHCLDRGDTGLTDTLDFLDQLGIPHSGVRPRREDCPWVAIVVGDLRIGFHAACWGLNNPDAIHRSALHIEVLSGLAPAVRHPVDLGRIRAVLADMATAGMDFRIIYLHWGYEFEFYPCPELMQVGREIIRSGADVVAGSHPHVVQPLEVCFVNGYEERYRAQGLDLPALREGTGCLIRDETGVPRKGLIVYSLGNFATAMFTPHCRTGLVLSLRLERDSGSNRVDWHRPEMQLVYNEHRDPGTRQRRLMLLENFLRERERSGDRADRVRRLGTWLESHLLGQPSCVSAAGSSG